jgi:hypothetical protein
MTVVFGRSPATPHPYDAALNEWLELGPEDRRIMACNIKHDHRVSKESEEEFDRWTGGPRSAIALQLAISDYYEDRVRTSENPDYLDEVNNGHNFLSGSALGRHIISKSFPLARIVDLNGLYPVYRWAKDEGIGEFLDLPSNPMETCDWLDDRLDGTTETSIERFVTASLGAMAASRRDMRHQPTWATGWDAFVPRLAGGPRRWAEALGLPKPEPATWLILLSYTAGEAGAVLRPTQLQAGWRAHHFPSPPIAPLYLGGHPMDLIMPGPAEDLLPEYIHQPIDHPIDHWIAAGRRCAPVEAATADELVRQRENHHALLCSGYRDADSVCAWMPVCWSGCSDVCNAGPGGPLPSA